MPKRKKPVAVADSPPPQKTVRRSTRKMGSLVRQDDGSSSTQDDLAGGPVKQVSQMLDSPESQDVFERTMRELGEMGQKLHSAVQKQRLAIETSDLSRFDAGNPLERPFESRPRPVPRRRPTRNEIKDEPKVVDKAPPAVADEGDVDVDMSDTPPEAKVEPDSDERAAKRPPPVNSDILPLPWKGRLGYACLNTYLRSANPPVFSSRTCRISSIIDHRYPLQDPTQPEHPTKNRPDKTQEPDIQRGLKYVQGLGLANAKDIVKMIRWNDKYGIKFMRLSSEMFPFASHDEYGYKLAPFAAGVLAEAGRVAAELGHRLTTHPGQYTQIASPRREVVANAMRDLEYHDEMLSLLKLPEQQDRDAIMILHMGGTYGDKAATLDRFRENYAKLSDGVKKRLVLENDDVSWSVHDLLPICEELDIPLVLDYHHHNIIFDSSIREGTLDIMKFYDRIRKTWTRKNITQKMHYSEPTAGAVTPRDRRKHSARVKVLPPCDPTMDLMIEAKDKEQAVFELMRIYKLPGWHLFNDVVPFERDDEIRKSAIAKKPKKAKKGKKAAEEETDEEEESAVEKTIGPDEFAMGGPQRRVFWPEGLEDWLKPKKKEVKKTATSTTSKKGVLVGDDE